MRFSNLLILCFLFSISIQAQDCVAIKDKTTYSFWLHTPAESSKKEPVFVFLHGKSLCGTNLDKVKRYGMLYAMERGHAVPGIVIAPQSQKEWEADKVIEVLDYVLKNNPQADSTRIYICGMSLGAYGTMEVAGKYPERFAAAVAICGGGNVRDAENLSKLPIWLIHGTADKIVPMSESKKLYDAIKNIDSKAKVTFKKIKGGTHGSVERLFHQPEIYDWMLTHKRE